jgi:phosphoribosyl-AMP cyclohydrolase
VTDDRQAVLALEEGSVLQLDYTKTASIPPGLNVIPVAVQNADTKEVILVAYANEQALQHSIRTKIATFWSTSRNELWIKGESSGNLFQLLEIRVNCEQNSLLYLVRPKGDGICHTRNSHGQARNCFYRRLDLSTGSLENLDT